MAGVRARARALARAFTTVPGGRTVGVAWHGVNGHWHRGCCACWLDINWFVPVYHGYDRRSRHYTPTFTTPPLQKSLPRAHAPFPLRFGSRHGLPFPTSPNSYWLIAFPPHLLHRTDGTLSLLIPTTISHALRTHFTTFHHLYPSIAFPI